MRALQSCDAQLFPQRKQQKLFHTSTHNNDDLIAVTWLIIQGLNHHFLHMVAFSLSRHNVGRISDMDALTVLKVSTTTTQIRLFCTRLTNVDTTLMSISLQSKNVFTWDFLFKISNLALDVKHCDGHTFVIGHTARTLHLDSHSVSVIRTYCIHIELSR